MEKFTKELDKVVETGVAHTEDDMVDIFLIYTEKSYQRTIN